MKRMLILFFMAVTVSALAKDKETKVKTSISEATVFESGAQVVRSGKASIPAGTSLLIFDELNTAIVPSQILFNGKGDFTVLASYHRYQVDTIAGWDVAEDRKKLEKERTKLQQEIAREQGWLQIYDREEQMLQANQIFGSKEDGIEITKLKEAAEFVRQRYLDIRTKRLEIQDRIDEMNVRVYEINNELNMLGGIQTKQELQYMVRINSEKQQYAEFNLTYQVANAGWTTGYDARVNSVSEPLELIQNAHVFQNSGEDWEDIDLIISTGTPSRNHTKPNLSPWYINQQPVYQQPQPTGYRGDLNQGLRAQAYDPSVQNVQGRLLDENGQPLIGATIVVPGTTTGTVTDVNGYYNLNVPQGATTLSYNYVGYQAESLPISTYNMNVYMNSNTASLNEVVISSDAIQRIDNGSLFGGANKDNSLDLNYAPVAIAYTPTSTKFEIEAKYNIPSDGTRYVVKMQDILIPADFVYQCTPKLDPSVYLTARITDWEDYNLFDGNMNIYFEDSYVGQAQLGLQYVEDTLTLSLGQDERIEVKRRRIKADRKNQAIQGTRKDVREWNYVVRNNKRERINIQVDDHIPVTTSEEVEIEAETLDGGHLNEATGRVVWDYEIPSGKQKAFKLKYSVKYPKELYVRLE